MSNLEGTTFSEVLVLTLVIVFASLLRKTIQNTIKIDGSTWLVLLTDFAVVVVPGILALTVLSENVDQICAAILVAAAIGIVRMKQLALAGRSLRSTAHVSHSYGPTPDYVFDSLTEYRSILCLYTFISILAVDFRAFPRRFAKAEVYGTGLMDVGVGSFIISDALFSKLDHDTAVASSDKSSEKNLTKLTLKASLQLALVGILRIALTKAISYQEHVGEYGVHWNFFVTLALVKLLGLVVPTKACGLIGLLIASSYQFALSGGGLAGYVNEGYRDPTNLFSLNKEGIISLAGYFALHCLARFYALSSEMHVLTERHYNKSSSEKTKKQVAFRHFYYTCFFTAGCWTLAYFLDAKVERVSRRSVNAAYIFWVMANNLTWLSFTYVGRLVLDLYENVHLCSTINKFAFFAFLFANVLVGVINSAVNTLAVDSLVALATVASYMLAICVFTHILYSKAKHSGKKKINHTPESEL